MSRKADFLIECRNPHVFDKTINSLGAAALIENSPGDYMMRDGYYIMRVFGDPGYIKFAITHQGYGKIIKEIE
jgi:hypothetical protein